MTWPRWLSHAQDDQWLSQCVHHTLNKDVHQWIAQNVCQWLCQHFHQWIGQHFCQLKGNNFIKKLEKWRNKIWFTSPLVKLTGEDIWLVQEFGTWSEKITVSFSSKDFIVTKSHIKVTSTFLSFHLLYTKMKTLDLPEVSLSACSSRWETTEPLKLNAIHLHFRFQENNINTLKLQT